MPTIYTPSSIPLRIPFAPNRRFNFVNPIRIRNRTTKLTNYQIDVDLNTSNFAFEKVRADGADIRFQDANGKALSFWIESWSATTAKIWVKLDELESYEDRIIWMIYGNYNAANESNGNNTFSFFDDFTGLTINEKYLTSWSKSGSNPLQTKTCQNWLCAAYSNYNNEDKIYIFEQRDASPNNTIECSSFTRANAATSAQWTDHGVVFTGVAAHDDGHVEPHGIIFETQSMADAREDVGEGLGTPKWRLYYCAKGSGEGVDKYSANFAYASESDLTSWTAYASNPVYDHDATYGYADCKVCIYDDKVWMHHCKYTGAVSCNPAFFSVSDDGISNWTNKTRDWHTERTVVGTLVPFSTGVLLTGDLTSPNRCAAFFTTDGDNKATYSGNPILSLGTSGQWDDYDLGWYTIVVDKNGSADLNDAGTYYMYYIGDAGSSTFKLGLATSTTLTEETETSIDTSKWIEYGTGGTVDIASSICQIKASTAGTWKGIRSINTFMPPYAFRSNAKIMLSSKHLMLGFFKESSVNPTITLDNYAAYIEYSNSDYTIESDGASYDLDTISWDNTNYLKFEIMRDSNGNSDFIIDDVIKDNDHAHSPIDATRLWISNSQEIAYEILSDWIFIRTYTAIEPLVEVL